MRDQQDRQGLVSIQPKQVLPTTQAGFRKGNSTNKQVVWFVNDIEVAFLNINKLVCIPQCGVWHSMVLWAVPQDPQVHPRCETRAVYLHNGRAMRLVSGAHIFTMDERWDWSAEHTATFTRNLPVLSCIPPTLCDEKYSASSPRNILRIAALRLSPQYLQINAFFERTWQNGLPGNYMTGPFHHSALVAAPWSHQWKPSLQDRECLGRQITVNHRFCAFSRTVSWFRSVMVINYLAIR